MMQINKKVLCVLSVIVAVLLVPLLREHFQIIWKLPYYKALPVVAVFILGYFAVLCRRGSLPSAAPCSKKWLVALFLLSILMTGAAYLYHSTYFISISLILWMGLLGLLLSHFRTIPNLFTVWGLLFFFVRPPGQVELRFVKLLVSESSKIGAEFLGYLGVLNSLEIGNLQIDGIIIKVDSIVNGVFSFYSVAFLFVAYAVLKSRANWHLFLLLISSIVTFFCVSVVRVIAVGLACGLWKMNIIESGWNYLLVIASFVLSWLILLSFDAFYSFTFGEIEALRKKENGSSLVRAWNWFVGFKASSLLSIFQKPFGANQRIILSMPVLVLGGGLLLTVMSVEALTMYHRYAKGDYKVSNMHSEDSLFVVDPSQVVFDREGWTVIDVTPETRELDSIWGAYSMIWRLRYKDVVVVLAVDYPFSDWHDVKACYVKLGWTVDDSYVAEVKKGDSWTVSETHLTLPTKQKGFILCSHCDHLGGTVQPKPTDKDGLVLLKYKMSPRQWAAPFGDSVDRNKNTFYQTQATVKSTYPLDEATKKEVREVYSDFREQIRTLIKSK